MPVDEREPLLVRLGVSYLRRFSGGARPVAEDAIHLLNPEERKKLKAIERGAIARAALAGALSSLVSATVEAAITRPFRGEPVRFYAVLGGATVVASAIEILFLYWDGLRSVHRLAHDAGLDLFPETEDDDAAVAAAMARAALELPNPLTNLFGVDPRREASRLRLLFASIVYKAKVSVTNFLVKMIVRRTIGRALVRSWLPFVAVPFTAIWDAIVCRTIMREARIRAMGPSAAREMITIVLRDHESRLSPALAECVMRAVASSIVRTEDLHPNLVTLLHDVSARTGIADGTSFDDTRRFLELIRDLPANEQTCVLRVLAIASIIDGRLTRNEKRLVSEALAICGRAVTLEPVEALRRAFISGDPLVPEQITALA